MSSRPRPAIMNKTLLSLHARGASRSCEMGGGVPSRTRAGSVEGVRVGSGIEKQRVRAGRCEKLNIQQGLKVTELLNS